MRRIPIHYRDGSLRCHALVDDEDYEDLAQWRWCIQGKGYVARRKGPRGAQMCIYMHNYLLGGMADHISGDRLDNRRKNLRPATHGLNAQNKHGLLRTNRSGYREVAWEGRSGKWLAVARVKGKQYRLGLYATPEAAHAVVSAWRAEHMPYSADARLAAA